jgi:hypothetical protein
MPWKECSVMDERLRFVARLLDRRIDVPTVLPGVRDFPQDRLQDPHCAIKIRALKR